MSNVIITTENGEIKYRKDKNSYTAYLKNGKQYTYSESKYPTHSLLMAKYSLEHDCRIENYFIECDDYYIIYAYYNQQPKEIYVDKDDFHLVSHLHWHIDKDATNEYARTNKSKANILGETRMHRFICYNQVKGTKLVPDHINGNGLDNRKQNLRVTTSRLNSTNQTVIASNNTSGITGVRFNPDGPRWTAIWCDKDTGKVRSKSFSCKVYGNENAKQKAIDYRKKMEIENEYLK